MAKVVVASEVGKRLEKLLFEERLPLAEAARQLKIPYHRAYGIAQLIGWDVDYRSRDTLSREDSQKAILTEATILAEIKKGTPQATIARQAGVSRQRIFQILVNAGLRKAPKPTAAVLKMVERAEKLFYEGKSVAEMAAILGKTVQWVYRFTYFWRQRGRFKRSKRTVVV